MVIGRSDKFMKSIRGFTLPFILVVLTAWTFSPVLGAGFFYVDDAQNLTANPNLSSLAGVLHLWSAPYQNLYIPLTYTLWALVGGVAGATHRTLTPYPFHLLNWCVHLANTVLVYVTIRNFLLLRAETKGDREGSDHRPGDWRTSLAAGLAAALWALHPLQVETVAWASSFKDLSSGFFSLCCLLCFVCARRMDVQARTSRRLLGLSTLAFAAALLCKPSAISLPFVVLLWQSALPVPARKDFLVLPAVWFALSGLFVAITQFSQNAVVQLRTPWIDRPIVATDALWFYAGKFLVPLGFCIDYGRTPDSVVSEPHAALVLTGTAAIGLLLLVAWKQGIRWPLLAAGTSVAFLLPVLGFVPFAFQVWSTVSDRYAYLALLGPALAAGQVMSWATLEQPTLERPAALAAKAKVSTCLCLAFIATCGVLSHKQAGYWRTPSFMLLHTLKVNPESAMASMDLGTIAQSQGNWWLAHYYFLAFVRESPVCAYGYNELGVINYHLGREQQAAQAWLITCRLPNTSPTDRADAEMDLAFLAGKQGNHGLEATLDRAARQDLRQPGHPAAQMPGAAGG